MINKKLMDFLCEETSWEDLGNQNLLHGCPEFGEAVGAAINDGALIGYTKELSGRLDEMDMYKASLLSNFIGFACEKENDASAGEEIVRLFARSCQKVYELFLGMDEDSDTSAPDDIRESCGGNKEQAGAYYGFDILCVSTMAFLTRDAALRKRLFDMGVSEAVRYLSEDAAESPYLRSVHYVNYMLSTCSDLKLLVLYPEKKKGFYAAANDINNCFHLLFLMEEQIYKKLGDEYGMKEFAAHGSLVKLAHGEYPDDCWDKHYGTYFMECNYVTAQHDTFENDDVMSMIWGEMAPESIPQIDGRAVIVLFGTGINRGFSADFLAVPHEALKPYVEIERELDREEYDGWIGKIMNRLRVNAENR